MGNINRILVRGMAWSCLALLSLSACRDEQMPRPEQTQSSQTQEGVALTLNAEAYTSELSVLNEYDNQGRALTFNLAHNPDARKTYPLPQLAPQDGQEVPVVVILRKAGQSAIVKQLNWTWKVNRVNNALQGGRLIAKDLNLSGDDRFRNRTRGWNEGWKMFCIVGGQWNEDTKSVRFDSDADGPKSIAQSARINAIYMSKDWVDISITQKGGKILLEADRTTFVNKCVTLLCRAVNQMGGSRYFRGFHIRSEKLSFEGTYANLDNLEVGKHPVYTKSNDWRSRIYKAISGVDVSGHTNYQVAHQGTTDFFVTTAIIPDNQVLNPMRLRVSSIIGQDHGEDGRMYSYEINNNNKGVKAGDFLSIKTVEVKAAEHIGHPIEQFLRNTHAEEIMWAPDHKARFIEALDAEARNQSSNYQHYSEYSAIYSLPSADEARILFPGHRGDRKGALGYSDQDPAVLMFDNSMPKAKTYKEFVKMYNNPPFTYTSTYKSYDEAPHIIYGDRFVGPELKTGQNPKTMLSHLNRWRSAYRYEQRQAGVLIRVRYLGPKTKLGINDIAKEAYWNSDPGFGNEEYRIFVPKGRYWTRTAMGRVAAGKEGAIAVMRVLSAKERTTAGGPYQAYVTDPEHKAHGESPKYARDPENFFFLITRPQDPRGGKSVVTSGSGSGNNRGGRGGRGGRSPRIGR